MNDKWWEKPPQAGSFSVSWLRLVGGGVNEWFGGSENDVSHILQPPWLNNCRRFCLSTTKWGVIFKKNGVLSLQKSSRDQRALGLLYFLIPFVCLVVRYPVNLLTYCISMTLGGMPGQETPKQVVSFSCGFGNLQVNDCCSVSSWLTCKDLGAMPLWGGVSMNSVYMSLFSAPSVFPRRDNQTRSGHSRSLSTGCCCCNHSTAAVAMCVGSVRNVSMCTKHQCSQKWDIGCVKKRRARTEAK